MKAQGFSCFSNKLNNTLNDFSLTYKLLFFNELEIPWTKYKSGELRERQISMEAEVIFNKESNTFWNTLKKDSSVNGGKQKLQTKATQNKM